jgi:hypothetical protein
MGVNMLMEKEDVEQLFESLIEALESFRASGTVLNLIEEARYEFETQNDTISSAED